MGLKFNLKKEFNDTINNKGVLDIAIGIALGTTFARMVITFWSEIILPPIVRLFKESDLSSDFIWKIDASDKYPAVPMNYGLVIGTILEFTILMLAILFVCYLIGKKKNNK